ncbi:hypothetical protein ACQP2Y_21315 [Actinoplanes sp. CA-051413]|uniref:hypothetical protein n=1 Tax=Actinoplanes sp. CA-051413 TaxID=3239899 RepID=UPI003D98F0FD
MTANPTGFEVTVPADVAAEMGQRCRTGEFDVRRLRLELTHRLGVVVPSRIAEALYAIYLEGDS